MSCYNLKNHTPSRMPQELLTQTLEWPHVRESKTVLESTLWILDFRY